MPDEHEYKYDAFLSYNSKDKEIVTIIARRLKDEGIKVWFDVWNMRAGMPWQEALEQTLHASRVVVVFIGADGFGKWENEEMRIAIDVKVRNPDLLVIPVLLPNVPKERLAESPFLSRHSGIFYGDSLDDPEAFHRLLAGIRGEEPGDVQHKNDPKLEGSTPSKEAVANANDASKPDELLHFVNQVDIIKFITSAQSPAYHLIDAPAGFGKTKLLKELKFRFEEMGWVSCYVAIQNQRTADDVIYEIAQLLQLQIDRDVSGKKIARALMEQHKRKICAGMENGVILFIDLEKPWPSKLRIVDALLDAFIPDTADALRDLNFFQGRYNPFRVVIASRYLTGRLAGHSKINPVAHKLAPFNYKTILEAVHKRLPDQPDQIESLTAHIMYYTGGHPGCISQALTLYQQQNCPDPGAFFNNFEQDVWENVRSEIDDIRYSIDDGLRPIFDDISVFRFLDSGILRDLLRDSTYLDEFKDEFDLQDKLRCTYLMDPLHGGPFLRDGITRKLLSLRLLNDIGKKHFMRKCNKAQDICKARLTNPITQMPDRWLVEYLYQYLQQYIADIQDSDAREKIRGEFFNTIIPESFSLFALARNPREYRMSFEDTLNEDWEFQFTVNYFLRTDSFQDNLDDSPWALTKKQLLELFK